MTGAKSAAVAWGVMSAAAAAALIGRPIPAPSAGATAGRDGAAAHTYSRDVAAILRAKCASCHHAGEVAPFSLVTYEDARRHARQIAAVTKSRFMPPWKADSHGEFNGERRLTDAQIETLAAWADAGAPKGDAAEIPPPPTFRMGWKLGQPDRIVGLTEPFAVGAEGRDIYRCFVIPTNDATDRYISALEVRPGNRAIVHHVIAYVDTSGAARKLDEKDPGPGYTTSGGGPGFIPAGFLGGWAPGNEPRFLPDGIGNLLPKGSDIVLEVHYHRSGKAEMDQTQVGLYYTRTPVAKRVRMLPVINPFFKIPAGASNYAVNATSGVFRDISVLEITPHMHLLGRSMKVVAQLPNGAEQPLIDVPDWDFNWQISYGYKTPVKLPKGTTVKLVARYDNSTANPRNPNTKPRDVGWGEQTTDEMCIAFLGYTLDGENLLAAPAAAH